MTGLAGLEALLAPLVAPHRRRLRRLKAALAVATPDGSGLLAFGGENPEAMADAIFEIGSVSKVLTALLLADLVVDGRIALDEPIGPYLPEAARGGPGGAGEITFLELTTHTSGLPRLPDNLRLTAATLPNPYAAYSMDDLWACVARLRRPPGAAAPEYSNLGVGLLGNVLATVAGATYEAAVRERVLAPLGMADTAIALAPEQLERLELGHTRSGRRAVSWDLPTLAGAGAWRSSARDMLRFLEANMNPPAGRLGEAIRLCQAARVTVQEGVAMGMAWVLSDRQGGTVVWHNGGTGGYNSWVGFAQDRGVGAAVLTNYTVPARAGVAAQADAIGEGLLAALA